MAFCKKCGSTLNDSAEPCGKCNEKTAPPIPLQATTVILAESLTSLCSHCGATIKAGANCCTACGQAISGSFSRTVPAPVSPMLLAQPMTEAHPVVSPVQVPNVLTVEALDTSLISAPESKVNTPSVLPSSTTPPQQPAQPAKTTEGIPTPRGNKARLAMIVIGAITVIAMVGGGVWWWVSTHTKHLSPAITPPMQANPTSMQAPPATVPEFVPQAVLPARDAAPPVVPVPSPTDITPAPVPAVVPVPIAQPLAVTHKIAPKPNSVHHISRPHERDKGANKELDDLLN